MRKSVEIKTRKVTPPSPSYMNNDQFASYLSELRSNRTTRPGGARPQPTGARPGQSRNSLSRYSLDATSQAASIPDDQRTPSQAPSVGRKSVSSRYSMSSSRGRDSMPAGTSTPLRPSDVVPTATYMERGQRWMEKEEAFSLRDAMEQMELREGPRETSDEDSRVHDAALNEAAELVWQHQNGTGVPRPDGPYRYRPHLRKNSYAHARTASQSKYPQDAAVRGQAGEMGSRSVSGSSTDSSGCSRTTRPVMDTEEPAQISHHKKKVYGSVGASSNGVSHRRQSSMKRNISGEVARPFSGDQIWEEPESSSTSRKANDRYDSPDTLGNKPHNPMNRVRFQPSREEASAIKPLNRVEIHRNPPAQSRDPQYTTNAGLHALPRDAEAGQSPAAEIRSQDIRDATSLRLKDRSPRLPEPTAVSDNPGRPIVSFDTSWKAPDESTDSNPDRPAPKSSPFNRRQPQRQSMAIPYINVEEDNTPRPQPPSGATIPSICVAEPDEMPRGTVPAISVDVVADEVARGSASIPSIMATEAESVGGARPLPSPGARGSRPSKAQKPRGHWSPAPGTQGRVTAICHECGFPIEGRFVALAGSPERFHPTCFSCFSCGTGLEAMEISPEPEPVRNERLDRLRRRAVGEALAEEPGMTMAEDGDDRLRFYCHLDWHELFAPRCKHCKTPILGEHVVALGHHWHNGHFFCAECGDPFQHGMTHIEKDGYAWCINCQTKRTERRAPKCKKCNVAVIGEYIQALGGEWHEHCFRCAECQGGFDDGQIFPKEVQGGTAVLCTGCRTKELKL